MAYVFIIKALEEVIIGYLNAWPQKTCESKTITVNKVSIETHPTHCNVQSER